MAACPHEDDQPRDNPKPIMAVPGDEQHRRLKPMCQDAQDAELDAQLVRKDGRSREVRRGGWGVCE